MRTNDASEVELQQKLDSALSYYEKSQIFEAYTQISELEQAVEQLGQDGEALKQKLALETKIPIIKQEYNEAQLMMQDLKSDEGWGTIKDTPELRVHYRPATKGGIHSLRMQAELRAPLLNLLVLINEVDLYKEWIPFLEQSSELAAEGYRKVIYMKVNLPWPFASRDLVTYGYTIDRLVEERSLLIIIRNPSSTDAIKPSAYPAEAKGTVRMGCEISGVLLQPLSADSTLVYQIANIDPQLSYIPNWLLNFGTRTMAPTIITLFGQKAAHLQGKHRQRFLEKKDFYDKIKEKLGVIL